MFSIGNIIDISYIFLAIAVPQKGNTLCALLDTVAELFRPSIKIRTHGGIFSLAVYYKIVLKTVFVKCAGLFKKLQPVVTAFRQLLYFIIDAE